MLGAAGSGLGKPMFRVQNAVVLCGVVGGVLLALWFSTVVALGPAPGNVRPSGEGQQSQPKGGSPKNWAPPNPDKPHTAEHETYCQDATSKKDCIVALRNAEAAERQANFAKYSFWVTVAAVALSALGLLLLKWTLDATRKAALEAEKAARSAYASVKQSARLGRQQTRDMGASIKVSRVSAEAAAESNRLSQAFFIATERPWLKAELAPGGPLFYNVNGLNLTIRFRIQNIGRSPARNIHIDPKLFAPAIGIDHAFDPQSMHRNAIAESKRRGLVPWGPIVFPGDAIVQDYTMSIGSEELKRITTQVSFIHLTAYGCISYGTAFDASVRATGFIVEVRRSDVPRPDSVAKNRVPDGIFPDEGDIPAAELRLWRSPLVSEYAD